MDCYSLLCCCCRLFAFFLTEKQKLAVTTCQIHARPIACMGTSHSDLITQDCTISKTLNTMLSSYRTGQRKRLSTIASAIVVRSCVAYNNKKNKARRMISGALNTLPTFKYITFKLHSCDLGPFRECFEPCTSGPPYYCTVPACVPTAIGGLAVWRHNNKKKKCSVIDARSKNRSAALTLSISCSFTLSSEVKIALLLLVKK